LCASKVSSFWLLSSVPWYPWTPGCLSSHSGRTSRVFPV
jgi:hypothetical protein